MVVNASLPSAPARNPASLELRIGDWRVSPTTNQLARGGETVRLEPKVMEVLAFLAEQPGQVVSRDARLGALWPGMVVGDDALTQVVIKLRKALGDTARSPAYIETISKRGYRLVAPVDKVTAPAAEPLAETGMVPPATT